MEQGRYAAAEPILVRTLDLQRRVLGNAHPDAQLAKNVLGELYLRQARYDEAEPIMLDAVKTQTSIFGDSHPYTFESVMILGRLLDATGRHEEARALLEPGFEEMRSFLGRRDPNVQLATVGLAEAYAHLGRRDEALELLRDLRDFEQTRTRPPETDAPALLRAATLLLMPDFEELQDPDRALRLAQRACERDEAAGGTILWRCLDTLAAAQHLRGDADDAAETQRRALALMPEGADPEMAERLAEYEAALSGPPDGERR
jgi:tetratricopeptide (TPR) repeat protein